MKQLWSRALTPALGLVVLAGAATVAHRIARFERIAADVGVLAADSMLGRPTPSRTLNAAARYVESELEAIGLSPFPPAKSLIQHYSIERVATDTALSAIRSAGGAVVHFGRGIEPFRPMWRGKRVAEAVLLEGGVGLGQALSEHSLERKHIIIRPSWGPDQPNTAAMSGLVRATLGQAGRFSSVMIVVEGPVSEVWAPQNQTTRPELSRAHNVMFVKPGHLDDAIQADIDGAQTLDVGNQVTLSVLGQWIVQSELRLVERMRASNVVGVIRGSDGTGEAVAISAHFDHIGTTAGSGAQDTINNGADDNASGVAALIEVARLLARKKEMVGRTVLFAAFSGEERGLWGSDVFFAVAGVEPQEIVANINLDMVGRETPDGIITVGGRYSSLGEVMREASADEPLMDGAGFDDLFLRSDNFSFARRGVPSVLLTSGLHDDYHTPRDEMGSISVSTISSVAAIVSRAALRLSSGDARPRWEPGVRSMIVDHHDPALAR